MIDVPFDSVVYCDSSALVRAYLSDEPGHSALSVLLLDDRRLIVTSAVTEVEVVAAIQAAARASRRVAHDLRLVEASADLGDDGHVVLIELEPRRVLPRARALCMEHRLRALDAIHLAVALDERDDMAGQGELVFVTRDDDQAAAARAEGLAVA